jgi:hypothetical protein
MDQRICLLNVLKCDFVDIDEAMLHDVERLLETRTDILGIQKRDLVEFAEVLL